MKKAIVSAVVGVLAVSAIALTAVSGDYLSVSENKSKANTTIDFIKATVDEVVKVGVRANEKAADAFAGEKAPAKIEVAVPGQKDTVTAKYDSSLNATDGSVIDIYFDENDSWYMLDCSGRVTSANVDPADKKTAVLGSVDELRPYAYEYFLTLTDTPERFTETSVFLKYDGINYVFEYCAFVGEYRTVNIIDITIDPCGNVTHYYIRDRIDFSGINLDALAALTHEKVEAYAIEQVSSLYTKGYDFEVNYGSTFLDKDADGQYYLAIKVYYKYDKYIGRDKPLTETGSEYVDLYF